MIFVKSMTKKSAKHCLHPKLCNSFIFAFVAITPKVSKSLASTKMSVTFEIVKHSNDKHFVYLVDEKQLFCVLKSGKKATTYRCRNRKSNCKCTIKIRNGTCTYVKSGIPHNHDNDGERDYRIMSALNNIEDEHDKAASEGKKLTARDLFNKANIRNVKFNANKRRMRRRVQKARKNFAGSDGENLLEGLSTLNDNPSTSEGINSNSIDQESENLPETVNETEKTTVLSDILIEPSTSTEITSNESIDLQNSCVVDQIEKLPIVLDEVMQSTDGTPININNKNLTRGNARINKTVASTGKLKIFKKYQPEIKLRNVNICINCNFSKAEMFFLPCKHGFCICCASNRAFRFERYLLNDIGLTKKEAKTISIACYKCNSHVKETCKMFIST